MVEDTDGGTDSVVLQSTASPGQFITPAGTIVAKNDTVSEKGRRLGVQDVPLIAACDYSSVPAYPLPGVAIISTGDEIVDVGAERNAGQVPDINRHTLTALLAQEGISARFLGIAVDDEEHIRGLVKRGLEHDMLLLSGGVSMGDYDLVAKALAREGVKPVFDRVSIKPGKPTFFGKKENRIIFGLPGNPVSVFVTFYFFVKTALRLLSGRKDAPFAGEIGRLSGGSVRDEDRTSFIPVRTFRKGREIFAAQVEFLGSSDDVAGLARANALMLVPEAPGGVEQGGTAHIYPFEPLF
jgi:molybdopterin molybdotransferase